VKQWIGELGSDSYKQRVAAERALRGIGKDALSALQSAAKESEDPEVQWRAKRLIRQIENGGGGDVQAREPAQPRQQGRDRPDARDQFEDVFQRLERDFGIDIPRRRFFRDDFFRDMDQQFRDLRRMQGQLEGLSRGMSMQIGPDGVRVEVQKRNDKGETENKVYEAPDMETFQKQYPDVMKRHGLMLGDGRSGLSLPKGFDMTPFRFGRALRDLQVPRTPRTLRPGLDRDVLRQSQRAPTDGERLGIFIRPEISAEVRQYLGLDEGAGLWVESVDVGSLADSLGLESGDIVTRIGGTDIGSPADVRKALSAIESGSDVEVQFVRKGIGKSATAKKPASKAAEESRSRIEPRKPGRTRIR